MSHSTGWEDAGSASVTFCNGQRLPEYGVVLSADDSQPTTCPRCGKKLRLVWSVKIEEVGDSGE